MNFTQLKQEVKKKLKDEHNLIPNNKIFDYVARLVMSDNYNIVGHFIIYAEWFNINDVNLIVKEILSNYTPVEEFRRA
jgi:hypothetical protein